MLRWLAYLVIIGSTIAIAWTRGEWYRVGSEEPARTAVEPEIDASQRPSVEPADIGAPLYPAAPPAGVRQTFAPAADPIVLRECRVSVIDKQEVPSPREGILLFIGTEIQPGEQVALADRINLRIGFDQKSYRRLKEGDELKAGQLVAYLDDRITRDEWAIKKAKVAAARAELEAAGKLCEEWKNRHDTEMRLRQNGVATEEEVRRARLSWDSAALDVVGKRQAVSLAEHELSQVDTVLRMHEIRTSLPGVVKLIYKNPREAVKSFEPVVRIHNLERVRVDGLVDVQYLPRLKVGMPAVIEPAPPQGPRFSLLGHLQDISGVAVSKTSDIVSVATDGGIIVWDRLKRTQRGQLKQAAAARCVACTEAAADADLCLTGGSDGVARLWNLDGLEKESRPLFELAGHGGAIACVAFSPDGLTCATGGEDRSICLWNTATGELRYRLDAAHRGTVTALSFTPATQLVSAGLDQTLRVWTLGAAGARAEATFENRSGHVASPGVSRDGRFVLFDDADKLRLLTLPDGATEGVIHGGSGQSFSTFARFAPNGRMIVTASGPDGPLQLWRAPIEGKRPALLARWMTPPGASITDVAFGPDSTFVVVSTRDRRLLIWDLPAGKDIDQELQASVTMLDTGVESSAAQVRVWAELPNMGRRLLPGATVTMVLYPE